MTYLLLTLVVATLQLLKQVKLEVIAEALPLPILFESRRKKLRRFLKLDLRQKCDTKIEQEDGLYQELRDLEDV